MLFTYNIYNQLTYGIASIGDINCTILFKSEINV